MLSIFRTAQQKEPKSPQKILIMPLLEIGLKSIQTDWIVTSNIFMESLHQELSNGVCGFELGTDFSRAISAGINSCALRAAIGPLVY